MSEINSIDEIMIDKDNDASDDEEESSAKNKKKKKKERISERHKEKDDESYLFEKNPNPNLSIDSYEDSLRVHSYNRLNESAEDIYRNNHKFSHINPIRLRRSIYAKDKKQEYKRHTREEAIKELITNLKTQYIIFNIRNFVRNYQIHANPDINQKNYKIALHLRNMSLYIYGVIMLFEKPWFCSKGTTIPLPSSFKFIEDCNQNIVFADVPFIPNEILRVIEILFTLIIAVTQIFKYKIEKSLKETNTGVNKVYNIIQIILFISLFLCITDSTYSLIVKKFPLINFLCRPFIYIYMIRRLRNNWTSILKVLWKTKKAYFVLFINMITFSVVGYVLFKRKGGFFESFGESVLQLYILLSTCNFPDIMFEAMEKSKFTIIYFVICLSINYFILLSYLNNLYTTKYYKVNKRDCLNIISDVIDNKYNKHIFNVQKFTRFLLKQKYLYHLSNEEYTNILVLFNLYNRNSDLYYRLVKCAELTPEVEMITNTKYGKYILESMVVEIIINILYLFCTISILFLPFDNIYVLTFHFISSLLILYEPVLLIKRLGFKRIIKKHFHRTMFHIFNLGVIFCLIFFYFLDPNKEEQKSIYNNVFQILKAFISLRTIRISVFLDKFKIIQNIYIIIGISKEMINRNILTLYSFILIFSTLSMLLTGGNIEKNSFEGEDVPNNYIYINFNDYASSYISCFCLLMINNLNILVKSLTYNSNHKMFFQFYFATFYFFSTLILINIIQTLILEMYLISDHSLSDKKDDKKNDRFTLSIINVDGIVNEKDNEEDIYEEKSH